MHGAETSVRFLFLVRLRRLRCGIGRKFSSREVPRLPRCAGQSIEMALAFALLASAACRSAHDRDPASRANHLDERRYSRGIFWLRMHERPRVGREERHRRNVCRKLADGKQRKRLQILQGPSVRGRSLVAAASRFQPPWAKLHLQICNSSWQTRIGDRSRSNLLPELLRGGSWRNQVARVGRWGPGGFVACGDGD